jgi:PAS domain S-box-containing protein
MTTARATDRLHPKGADEGKMERHRFPISGGSAGAVIRQRDWSGTVLGPSERWPVALRNALMLMLESPESMYLVWGADFIFFHNDTYAPVLGARLERAIGMPAADLWPDAWPQVRPLVDQALGGTAIKVEDLLVLIDREGRSQDSWWSFSYSPLRNDAGDVAGVICVTNETTGKVLAERARSSEVKRFRELFEQSPSFVAALHGPEHVFFLANPAYRRMVGDRELLGKRVRDALPEVAGQGLFEMLDHVLQTGEAVTGNGMQVSLRQAEGEPKLRTLDFVYQPIRDAAGAVTGVFVEGTDVTEAYATAQQLRISEDRNRQVLDSAIDYAIIASDLDGRITRWNAGAQNVLGWSEAEMLGQTAHRFFTPEDVAAGQVEREMQAALDEGRGADERWHLRKSGALFWASGEMTPLRDASGAVEGFVKVLRDRTAEHRTDEALRASEARLRRAQEAGQVGIFSVELATNVIYGTPEFCRIFGLDSADGIDPAIIEALVHPDDVELASHASDRLTGAAPGEAEYRIVHGVSGEIRRIARRAEFERDAAGGATRMVGVVQDVTERRAAQRAVELSEAKFRAFAQAVPNHVWTASADGVLDWANDRAYAYGGRHEADLLRDGWAAWLHPEDVEAAAAAWMHSVATGEEYATEFRIRRSDGVYCWHLARAVPLRDAAGAITGWLGTNTDIEQQKASEQALRELNDELEERVDARTRERDRAWRNSRDLIVVIDTAGIFHEVSPAARQILGWNPEEMIGKSVFDFIHPDDTVPTDDALDEASNGPLPTFENRYRHKHGGYRTLSWTAGPEDDLITATARDVTEANEQAEALLQAQEALRQAQKMEAVGQLTGGIAHDFNNLLTGITGNLELLKVRAAQGRYDALDRYVTAAQGAAQRAASLTQRLLAFSRRQTLDPRPTDVNRLVAGMDDLIRRSIGPDVGLEFVGAGGLWSTLVDAPQLENALLNLCINARDAMPGGGRITIETANKWLDARSAGERELPAGQYISLCVTDTGTGMTPEVISRAFDPFFTTKPLGAGTGLGLSMIYGFARQSGGQVRIYSEVGQGTTMCLYLPRHYGDDAVEEEDQNDRADLRAVEGETVLVVDDEPTIRLLVAEILEEAGYRILQASDGPAGVRIMESTTRIDLLVTDVGLPGGLNGRQVADAGRALRPGLKVLFITGYAENAAVGNGHLEPGMELLTKPFGMDELAARIRDMITTA